VRRLGLRSVAAGLALLAVMPSAAQDLRTTAAPVYTPPPSPGSGAPPWAYAWIGGGASEAPWAGGYAGIMAAWNGQIWSPGWVVRAEVWGGQYSYDTTAVPEGHVNVNAGGGALMIGHRSRIEQSWFGIYIGPSVESHANRDPTAVIRGTEGGVRIAADYYTPLTPNLNFTAFGVYSTVFDTYFVAAKLEFPQPQGFTFGPEVGASGNRDYNDLRAGGFLKVRTSFGEVIGSAGGYWPQQDDKDPGYYVNVHVGIDVRR